MKKIIAEFFRRGLVAFGFGPLVLAVIFLILQCNGVVETLSVNQVCLGIFSLSALAFVAGGMNVIYQVERLPLMVAGYGVEFALNCAISVLVISCPCGRKRPCLSGWRSIPSGIWEKCPPEICAKRCRDSGAT